jgi:hypothetical protein
MATNSDFRDLFAALSAARAEFIVVGAHAVMVHTEPRYTKDLDIWIRSTPQNAAHVYKALQIFGAPLADLTIDDLATPGTVFQIGVAPNRIDILTEVTAVDFEGAWQRRLESTYGGVPISLLSIEDLLTNKRAVGRPQDLIDVEKLERALPPRSR